MADATICPYCNAKLRIASAKRGTRNRVKCGVCKNRFHPSQILDHGESSRLNAPLYPVPESAEPESPAPEPEAAPLPAAPPPRVPVPVAAEPPALGLDPYVQESAFPAALVERRSERRSERRHDRAPGELVRVRSDRHAGSSRKQVKITLVAILLLAGSAIAVIAVWSYLKDSVFAVAPALNAPPTGSPTSLPPDLFKGSPLPSRELRTTGASRMVGIWEIRTDNETRGYYEFRKDGSLSMIAWVGELETKPLNSNWFVLSEEGDAFLLEIGDEQGAVGNRRLQLTMTSPDAFTLTRVDHDGIQNLEAKRFARRGPSQP